MLTRYGMGARNNLTILRQGLYSTVITENRTYELSGVTHVTPFRMYKFNSTGLCNYKL